MYLFYKIKMFSKYLFDVRLNTDVTRLTYELWMITVLYSNTSCGCYGYSALLVPNKLVRWYTLDKRGVKFVLYHHTASVCYLVVSVVLLSVLHGTRSIHQFMRQLLAHSPSLVWFTSWWTVRCIKSSLTCSVAQLLEGLECSVLNVPNNTNVMLHFNET